jgi:hypothetical protein
MKILEKMRMFWKWRECNNWTRQRMQHDPPPELDEKEQSLAPLN